MGTPIANLLMAQAAPQGQGIADSSISGLSPEAQEAIRRLNIQPEATPMPAPTPTPAPAAPAQGGGGILGLIKGLMEYFSPSTASIAAQAPPPPKPIQSSEAGDAAIEAEKKRNARQQQGY